MAVFRNPPICVVCGQPIEEINPDKGKDFVGDTFQSWDFAGHKCKNDEIGSDMTINEQFTFEAENKFAEEYSQWKHELIEGNLNLLRTNEPECWMLNLKPQEPKGKQDWQKFTEKSLILMYRSFKIVKN